MPKEDWTNRMQKEIRDLQSANYEEKGKSLPYYLVMRDCKFNRHNGTCEFEFLVYLDDDIEEKDGKMMLQRSSSSRVVMIAIDASIKKRPGTTVSEPSMSYPFFEPKITLTCGAGYFPAMSEINNGDTLKFTSIDDWQVTTSIVDVAVGMASRVRRSIRSGVLCMDFVKNVKDTTNEDKFSSLKMNEGLNLNKNYESLMKHLSLSEIDSNGITEEKEQEFTTTSVINLDDSPYTEAHGLFRCKIMKRPDFIRDMVTDSLLNSSTKYEDPFMIVVEDKLIEIKRPKGACLYNNKATIAFSIPLRSLIKIEFSSKCNTLMLYFKEDPRKALVYITPDCGKVAELLKTIMTDLGITGEHLSPVMKEAQRAGLELCNEIKKKQALLGKEPSIEQIKEIIDLHCLALEKLSQVRGDKHSQVITHMKEFLAKPKIARVMMNASNSMKKESTSKPVANVSMKVKAGEPRKNASSPRKKFQSSKENQGFLSNKAKPLEKKEKPETKSERNTTSVPFKRRVISRN